MNFLKISKMETKRVLFSRQYGYMLLISMFFMGYSLYLGSDGLMGTAPFSKPAIGFLMSMDGPIWSCMAIMLCRGIYSDKERAARKIVFSAPITTYQYLGAKMIGVLVGVGIIVGLAELMMLAVFQSIYGVFAAAAIWEAFWIMVFPGMLFSIGAALIVGRIRGNLLYVLFLAVLVLGVINFPIPLWLSLFGGELGNDVSYISMLRAYHGEALRQTLPIEFLTGRAGFLLIGAVLFVNGMGKKLRT